MRIGVYSSICEEDAVWIDQYLAEIERLDLEFAINLDRCSQETKVRLIAHPRCIGFTIQDDPAIEFTERHKQGVMDILQKDGFDWALAWDVDETWERDFDEKVKVLETIDADYIDLPWKNLWGDVGTIRTDGTFAGGHRVKFYRLTKPWNWHFEHPITNGAKHRSLDEPVEGKIDLVCLHHGMMTQELREFHKARWDRIYTAAVGNNPYGFWNYALDPGVTITTAPNIWR